MQREMYKTKNRNKNKSLGNVIKSRLDILKMKLKRC